MDGNLLTFLQHNRNLGYTAFLQKLKGKIYTPVQSLSAGVLKSKEPIAFAEALQSAFAPLQRGESWGGFFDCAWLKLTGDLDGVDCDTALLLLNVGGEGCVYNADGAVQGITNVLGMVDNFQPAKGKQVVPLKKVTQARSSAFTFYVDCGNNGKGGKDGGKAVLKRAEICTCREDLLKFYYDFLAVYQLLSAVEDKAKKAEIHKALRAAMQAAGACAPENIEKAELALQPLYDGRDKQDFTVYAVGHGHLDLAWLWPVRETKRKAVRTFSNAIYQSEQCPEYVFNGSQPQQYAFIEEKAPELFARIKTAVQKGNIEPQGGMWVEPDTNLPCGESLIRQCVYGKQYFQSKFGIDVKTLWLPDVFGYTAALPQIIQKSGMDNFMTIKLSWNNINRFPHHTFRWQGLDDSEVLVHMPPEGDYNSNATPYAIEKTYKQYNEKEVSDIALLSYGIGDGGGGPGEYHVQMAQRASKLRYIPKVKMASSAAFFTALQEKKDTYPQYKGELYLEKHQGTYTTQGRVKKNNRRTESLLHFAEWICTLATQQGSPYPKEKLDSIWKEVLLYQFHDILPGSSIHRVYEECNARYAILQKDLENLIDSALKALLPADGQGDALSAVNPTDFTRKGFLKYENQWYAYDILPYSAAKLEKAKPSTVLVCTEHSIENDKLRLEFNEKGQIVKFCDKQTGYNCVGSVFNAVRIYKDRFVHPYNAWDIDINYTKQTPRDMTLAQHRTYIDGSSVVCENTYTYGKSKLIQKIILTENSTYAEVQNQVSWHETHKMLRVDFYPRTFADKVLCDIQFGNLERSTKTESKVDYAQFEIPAHKWVDVYADGHGVAILNDCKYGHRVKDGLISLNCLRSPVYPDKTADRGEHSFTYAIYPHTEAPLQSELVSIGYALNNPLKLIKGTPALERLFSCEAENLIVETVFTNEKGNPALRVYENAGQETQSAFTLSIPHSALLETDMRFANAQPITGSTLHFKPYEIKTLEVLK